MEDTYETVKVQNKGPLPGQRPLAGVPKSILGEQLLPDEHLHQLVPVDLADHASGAVVVGNIGGILSQQVSDDLIDGVVAFFCQGLIHTPKNPAHIIAIVIWYCKFLRILIGHGNQPPSKRMESLYSNQRQL